MKFPSITGTPRFFNIFTSWWHYYYCIISRRIANIGYENFSVVVAVIMLCVIIQNVTLLFFCIVVNFSTYTTTTNLPVYYNWKWIEPILIFLSIILHGISYYYFRYLYLRYKAINFFQNPYLKAEFKACTKNVQNMQLKFLNMH